MNPEAFSDLAAARHSVRDFRPDPVPGEVLDAILDDARQAPSWSNTRPFMVALATGERADRLRAAYVAEFEAPADYGLITGFALGYASDAPVNDFRAERRAVRLVPVRS